MRRSMEHCHLMRHHEPNHVSNNENELSAQRRAEQRTEQLRQRAYRAASTALRLLDQGSFSNSNRYFRQAFCLYTQLKDWVKVGCTIHQLGRSYRNQSKWQQALVMFVKSAIIFRHCRRYDCYINCIFDINLLFFHENRFDEAKRTLKIAKRYLPHLSSLDAGKWHFNLALVYRKLNQPIKAVARLEQAVGALKKVSSDEKVESLEVVSESYLNLGESSRILLNNQRSVSSSSVITSSSSPCGSGGGKSGSGWGWLADPSDSVPIPTPTPTQDLEAAAREKI